MRLLSTYLKPLVREGHLSIVDAGGRIYEFGETDKPALIIRFHDKALERALFLDPQLTLGEAYMDGRLTVENGDIADFLDLAARNLGTGYGGAHWKWLAAVRKWTRRLAQWNTFGRARRNVAHHYDLSGKLYDLFLDADRQYSCALFETPDDTLETAQSQKLRRIARKLDLKPGQRVLDIGSGWGGLGLHLARSAGVDVTGITLSEEQLKIANRRADELGLSDRVRFRLEDYRRTKGRFDRIVSIGMFEHVGVGHYREYFDRLSNLLEDDGVALVHSIGRSDGPGSTNPWVAKYIFPGGYTPALSEVLPAVERSGLMVTDVEILRLHYALTLAEWRKRFIANWDRARDIYDERFCRMWEFYLAGSEMGFRSQGAMVFQLQLAKRIDVLPLTRDYMMPTPASLGSEEDGFGQKRRAAA
jgi:cyclopropane-fatty-acyl-phospholipid synthase